MIYWLFPANVQYLTDDKVNIDSSNCMVLISTEAITWINVDQSSFMSCDITRGQWAISGELG